MRYPLERWNESHNKTNLFGQSDPEMAQYYPLTLTHIGDDFAVPTGTPIFAPTAGSMIAAVRSAPKGFVGVYDFIDETGTNWALELCHLRELPKLGQYKEGDVIAYTGNTGSATTGSHLHCALHKNGRVTANYTELSAGPKGQAGRDRFLRMVAEGKIMSPFDYFQKHVQAVCPCCNRKL